MQCPCGQHDDHPIQLSQERVCRRAYRADQAAGFEFEFYRPIKLRGETFSQQSRAESFTDWGGHGWPVPLVPAQTEFRFSRPGDFDISGTIGQCTVFQSICCELVQCQSEHEGSLWSDFNVRTLNSKAL